MQTRPFGVQKTIRLQTNHFNRLLFVLSIFAFGLTAHAEIPGVGSKAPDFSLSTPTGTSIRMATVQNDKSLVLVVLRGFPGYQCPYCQKQVHDFVEHASAFEVRKTTVLLVYPGPPADLDQHANEFLAQ